jgi:hypothetical protein
MGGWLDELQESHFKKQLKQKPCINKVKYLFAYLMASCSCSSNYNKLVSVGYEISFFIKPFKMMFMVSLVCM